MTSYSAELTVSSTSFKEAASWALKGFSPKEDNEYILFEVDTENNKLTVSSVSSQYYFKDSVAVSSFEYHEQDSDEYRDTQDKLIKFAVDGSILSKVSGALPKGKDLKIKEVTKSKESVLTVSTSGFRFDLTLLENKRPPRSPDITLLGEAPAYDLINVMKPMARIADVSAASSAPALAALAFHLNKESEQVKIMSTDQYVLSEMIVGLEPNSDLEDENVFSSNSDFLVHAADAALVTKETPEQGSVVEIGVVLNKKSGNREKVAFTFSDGKSACVASVDADHIDYKNLMTERDEQHVVVNTKEFSEAVKVAGMMSWESDDVFITLGEGGLSVSNAKSSVAVQVDYDTELTNIDDLDTGEEDMTVQFLSSVATKALNPVSTERLKLSFVALHQFFRITPVLDSGDDQDGVFILFIPVLKKGN